MITFPWVELVVAISLLVMVAATRMVFLRPRVYWCVRLILNVVCLIILLARPASSLAGAMLLAFSVMYSQVIALGAIDGPLAALRDTVSS